MSALFLPHRGFSEQALYACFYLGVYRVWKNHMILYKRKSQGYMQIPHAGNSIFDLLEILLPSKSSFIEPLF